MTKIPTTPPAKILPDDDLPIDLNEGENSTDSLSRDPSDPPANRGRQVPEYSEADEDEEIERTVREGVEEAQHEQMVAGGQEDDSSPDDPDPVTKPSADRTIQRQRPRG
jgi:hypothetical protein